MGGSPSRWEGRRVTDAERFLAYKRILDGLSYREIAGEMNCSLQFLSEAPSTTEPALATTLIRRGTGGDQPLAEGWYRVPHHRLAAEADTHDGLARVKRTVAARSTARGVLTSVPRGTRPGPLDGASSFAARAP